MFVKTEAGVAVGKRILEPLAADSRAVGLSIMRLETGVSQPEAARLYERAGYVRCEGFGLYPHNPASVFMEKGLMLPFTDTADASFGQRGL